MPVTTRRLFQGGSLAKPVVALAALRLVQEGVLDLEADINTWLTSWKIPPNDGWQPRVTVVTCSPIRVGSPSRFIPAIRATKPCRLCGKSSTVRDRRVHPFVSISFPACSTDIRAAASWRCSNC